MKVNLKETKPTFEPVTLEITFESKEELIVMYNRMLLEVGEVHGNQNTSFNLNLDEKLSSEIFIIVSNILQELK